MPFDADCRLPPRPGRFPWLMALYAENHRRLVRMFDPAALPIGSYRSEVGDGLDLRVEVQERQPYTVALELSYGFEEGALAEPAASLRVYLDARLTEVCHCAVGTRFERVWGPWPPADGWLARRLNVNTFLGKWLEFLADHGHSRHSLRPWLTASDLSEGRVLACG
jgi:uncharacterized protein YqiB (DUF1249 family)